MAGRPLHRTDRADRRRPLDDDHARGDVRARHPGHAIRHEAEAVRLANDSTYGLGASVWSRSMSRARRIAAHLDAGMVWINDHGSSAAAAQAPWAGVKSSGHGIVHSKFGLYEMVEKRLVSEDRGLLPVAWWYPYDEAGRRAFMALLQTVYAPGIRASSVPDGTVAPGSLGSCAGYSGPSAEPPRTPWHSATPLGSRRGQRSGVTDRG
jgi:hypothetical protein